MSKVTLPNGGYVQYTFGGSNDGMDCVSGDLVNLTRTINDGTNSNAWQFVGSGGTGATTTTVTAPLMPYDSAANQSVYAFDAYAHETSAKFYQGSSSSGTLLISQPFFSSRRKALVQPPSRPQLHSGGDARLVRAF